MSDHGKLISGLLENLEYLDLSGIHLTEFDVQTLARGLRSNSTVTRLHLCDNWVGSDAIAFLCKELKHNRSLRRLALEPSDCGDKAAAAIRELRTERPDLVITGDEKRPDSIQADRPVATERTQVRRQSGRNVCSRQPA